MSIGLYDADFVLYKNTIFSLELMKLAAYYKRRNEIVILAPTFTPEKYTKFYYQKNYFDRRFINDLNLDNVEYGGLAFTNNVYVPMDIEIEKQVADTFIYNKYMKTYVDTRKISETFFKQLINAAHLRLSLDGKTIWKDYKKQLPVFQSVGNIVLHDYNLGEIKGAPEEISNLLNSIPHNIKKPKVGAKFPIIISNNDELIKWGKIPMMNGLFTLEYSGLPSVAALKEYIKNMMIKGNLNQFSINLCSNKDYPQDKLIQLMPEIFDIILFLRRLKSKIPLKYSKEFFKDERWGLVIQLFEIFRYSPIYSDTIIEYIDTLQRLQFEEHDNWRLTIEDIHSILRFIQQENPDLYRIMHEKTTF